MAVYITFAVFSLVLVHGDLNGLSQFCFFHRPEWYGMLYSQADSKKKSNLMMSVFEPGSEPLPWLGKISHLGPISGSFPYIYNDY